LCSRLQLWPTDITMHYTLIIFHLHFSTPRLSNQWSIHKRNMQMLRWIRTSQWSLQELLRKQLCKLWRKLCLLFGLWVQLFHFCLRLILFAQLSLNNFRNVCLQWRISASGKSVCPFCQFSQLFEWSCLRRGWSLCMSQNIVQGLHYKLVLSLQHQRSTNLGRFLCLRSGLLPNKQRMRLLSSIQFVQLFSQCVCLHQRLYYDEQSMHFRSHLSQ